MASAWVSIMSADMPVRMTPGQTALMRIPRGCVFERGALGQADDAVFGRVVGRASWLSDQAAEGGAVDDGAAALVAHVVQFVFHAGPHAAQVDCGDPVEVLGELVGGVAGWCLDAGVVE